MKQVLSERQAVIYELAESQWIDREDRDVFTVFFMKTKREIDSILTNYTDRSGNIDYAWAVLEFREGLWLHKSIPLRHLLQIFSIHKNEALYKSLWINPDNILTLPPVKVLNNEDIKQRWIIRTEDLEHSQNDNELGYTVELCSNSIDAAIKASDIWWLGGIWRFGEWFLQVLNKISDKDSQVTISTKMEWIQWYDITLEKKKINDWGDEEYENFISSNRNDKIESGTSVKLVKEFSQKEQEEIKKYLYQKFKTNTRARIVLNWKVLNSLNEYVYMNWEELDISSVPQVEINVSDSKIEFIDMWIWMSADDIVNKLLRPNATWNKRKMLTDEEVLESSPRQTKFFYKNKMNDWDKTSVTLNLSWVNIEEFEISTYWQIWDFTLEFPPSSPIKDSRNQIEISREVVIAMKTSLEKIHKKASSKQEKLDLLEIIWAIYERLKERASNIVDEQFILSTVMKDSFFQIQQDIEEIWVAILPASKDLVDNIGYPEGVFYISEEFIEFDIDNLPWVREIERVNAAHITWSFVKKSYMFYEVPFTDSAEHDYFIYANNVFVNSEILDWITVEEKDLLITSLNVWINLDIGYEIPEARVNYWRMLTSSEKQHVIKRWLPWKSKELTWISWEDEEEWNNRQINLSLDEQVDSILVELDDFREKYNMKMGIGKEFNVKYIISSIKSILAEYPYEKWDENLMACVKFNLLWGKPLNTNVININDLNYEDIFQKVIDFMNRKSGDITLPFLQLLWKIYLWYNWRENILLFNTDFYTYIETLIKVLDTDPKLWLEFIERFFKNYNWKMGYNLFTDYLNLELSNQEEEKERSIKNNRISSHRLKEIIIDVIEIHNEGIGYKEKKFKIYRKLRKELSLEPLLNFKETPSIDLHMEGFSEQNNPLYWAFMNAVHSLRKENIANIDLDITEEEQDLFYYAISPCCEHDDLSMINKWEWSVYYKKISDLKYNTEHDFHILIMKGMFHMLNQDLSEYQENSLHNEKYSELKEEYFQYLDFAWSDKNTRSIDKLDSDFCIKFPKNRIGSRYYRRIYEMLHSGELESTDIKLFHNLLYELNELHDLWEQNEEFIKGLKRMEDDYFAIIKRWFPLGGEDIDERLEIYIAIFHYLENEKQIVDQLKGKENWSWNKLTETSRVSLNAYKKLVGELYQISLNGDGPLESDQKMIDLLRQNGLWDLCDFTEGFWSSSCLLTFQDNPLLHEFLNNFDRLYWCEEELGLVDWNLIQKKEKELFNWLDSWGFLLPDSQESLELDDMRDNRENEYGIFILKYFFYSANKIGGNEQQSDLWTELLNVSEVDIEKVFFEWMDNAEGANFDRHRELLDDLCVWKGRDVLGLLDKHGYAPELKDDIILAYKRLQIKDQYASIEGGIFPENYEQFQSMLTYYLGHCSQKFIYYAYWDNKDMAFDFESLMLAMREDMEDFLTDNGKERLSDSDKRYLEFIPELMHFKYILDKALLAKSEDKEWENKDFTDEKELNWKNNTQQDENAYVNTQKKSQVNPFIELSKKYPQDLVTFVQFLKSGWEFLEEKESKIWEVLWDWENSIRLDMSDLIGLSLSNSDGIDSSQNISEFSKLYNEQQSAGISYESNKDLIAGVNISQDEWWMLFYREWTQNAIDAIKRYNKDLPEWKEELPEEIHWETYSIGNHFVSSVQDPVWIDLPTVISKLFTPYNTGKSDWGATGQFWKWFFTFTPNSKEINIKTSKWDGKVLYIKLIPKKENGIINNFDVRIDQREEQFQWTIVERVDDASWVKWNLRAMVGANLLKKYVWNVQGTNIEYNESLLNDSNNLDVLSISEAIVWKGKDGKQRILWDLKLFKNNDGISRLSKDGLFISEIKDELLSNLPDWIQNKFHNENLSIDIPRDVPLVWSRNSLRNKDYYIELLQPYLFKQVIQYILESYVQRDTIIPELPHDYLWMEKYDVTHSSRVLWLSSRFNSNSKFDINKNEISYLKNKKIMAEFLVLCNFQHDGMETSLRNIKNDLLEKSALRNSHSFWWNFQSIAATSLDHNQIEKKAGSTRYDLTHKDVLDETSIELGGLQDFEGFIKNNKWIQHLIETFFGWNFEMTYSYREWVIADSYSKGEYGMSFCINSGVFLDYVRSYNNPIIFEELLKTITHEMAHNLEWWEWWTHNDNFLKIQRMLVTSYTRFLAGQ